MSVFVVNGPVPGTRQHPLRTLIAIIAGLSVILAVTGACNTRDLGISHRLTLWFTLTALNVFQWYGLFLTSPFPRRDGRSP